MVNGWQKKMIWPIFNAEPLSSWLFAFESLKDFFFQEGRKMSFQVDQNHTRLIATHHPSTLPDLFLHFLSAFVTKNFLSAKHFFPSMSWVPEIKHWKCNSKCLKPFCFIVPDTFLALAMFVCQTNREALEEWFSVFLFLFVAPATHVL